MSAAARARRAAGDRRPELLLVGLLALVGVLLWALVPTYPNYDAYYHLVWGRELLDGQAPTFEAYAAPTEHPLYLGVAALLTLLGPDADRALVLLTVLCHVAFTWGVYRLGAAVWDRRAGLAAALLAGSSFALLLYAARGYVDEPFLALVLWAAALESERSVRTEGAGRGRGGEKRVWALLIAAGLLRPEGWLLAGLYWLWTGPRLRAAPLVALAPAVWCLVDGLVTGDPLFSLHSTSELADELGRRRSLSEVPGAFARFLADTAREPVAALGVLGALLAWRRREGRAAHVPLALFLAGTATFFATSAAGLSVLPRYLTVPAVALCLPAGWLVTRDRRVLALAVAAGLAFVVVRADVFDRLATELRFIRHTHEDLVAVLDTRQVADGRRCGPVTLPNYRLVPDTRWILDASQSEVGARSARERRHGVALFYVGEKLMRRYGFADGASPRTNAPSEGFVRAVRVGGFTAYVSCSTGPSNSSISRARQ
jgi:hypothetical protein